jgi:hypothetical protein
MAAERKASITLGRGGALTYHWELVLHQCDLYHRLLALVLSSEKVFFFPLDFQL